MTSRSIVTSILACYTRGNGNQIASKNSSWNKIAFEQETLQFRMRFSARSADNHSDTNVNVNPEFTKISVLLKIPMVPPNAWHYPAFFKRQIIFSIIPLFVKKTCLAYSNLPPVSPGLIRMPRLVRFAVWKFQLSYCLRVCSPVQRSQGLETHQTGPLKWQLPKISGNSHCRSTYVSFGKY